MTPTLRRQDNNARFAILPSGHVIEEIPNGGCMVVIAGYGTVTCVEAFAEALAQFQSSAAACIAELEAQLQEAQGEVCELRMRLEE